MLNQKLKTNPNDIYTHTHTHTHIYIYIYNCQAARRSTPETIESRLALGGEWRHPSAASHTEHHPTPRTAAARSALGPRVAERVRVPRPLAVPCWRRARRARHPTSWATPLWCETRCAHSHAWDGRGTLGTKPWEATAPATYAPRSCMPETAAWHPALVVPH